MDKIKPVSKGIPVASTILISLAVIAIIVICSLFVGDIPVDNPTPAQNAKETLQVVKNDVAAEQLRQYSLAQKGGDKMEIYVAATLVAEAFKQANNEFMYLQWKDIARKDAKAAGIKLPK